MKWVKIAVVYELFRRLAEHDGASDDEDVLDDIENKDVDDNLAAAEVEAARAFAKTIKGRDTTDKAEEGEEAETDDIDKKYNLEGYDEEEDDRKFFSPLLRIASNRS